MKIKLLKDIPGFEKLQIVEVPDTELYPQIGSYVIGLGYEYNVFRLLSDHLAEVIKDEIDMEEIREMTDRKHNKLKYNWVYLMSQDERTWFHAFCIVKSVIDTLNGNWKPDWNSWSDRKYHIQYLYGNECIFRTTETGVHHINILPYCKDRKTAEKVIELCGPELKILFNIK